MPTTNSSAIAAAAPLASEPHPGVTRLTGQPTLIGADGTTAYDGSGYLDTDPVVSGAYQLDGDVTVYDFDALSCTIGLDLRALVPDASASANVRHTDSAERCCTIHLPGNQTWLKLSPA